MALKETAPRPVIFYSIFLGYLEHRRFESADKQSIVVKILRQQICFGGSGTILQLFEWNWEKSVIVKIL